ncbi:hypothetical protein FAUST_425 [Fusarium austroamericanum]|uniref:Life-span regulatory factor domain-containing protein n=1 Tax=Fusarium austroamericanum TaxID=282268 RepID=A0AAN6CAC4_FUSAU|nr:hypothetical protein FAUST_425 [Fusarium austroamericanum]
MDFDSWAHSFCLACDKQVQSSSDAYCSESCRLADFEKTSTTSSQASSPGLTSPSCQWSSSSKSSSSGFYLSPAYDFSNAKPYGSRHMSQPTFKPYGAESTANNRSLTPSSSHSSLCSLQSTSTTGEQSQLSDKARKELRAYAVSFDSVRTQRRRSY